MSVACNSSLAAQKEAVKTDAATGWRKNCVAETAPGDSLVVAFLSTTVSINPQERRLRSWVLSHTSFVTGAFGSTMRCICL